MNDIHCAALENRKLNYCVICDSQSSQFCLHLPPLCLPCLSHPAVTLLYSKPLSNIVKEQNLTIVRHGLESNLAQITPKPLDIVNWILKSYFLNYEIWLVCKLGFSLLNLMANNLNESVPSYSGHSIVQDTNLIIIDIIITSKLFTSNWLIYLLRYMNRLFWCLSFLGP